MAAAKPEAESGLPHFVKDPFGVLRRRWKWMAPIAVLGVAGFFSYFALVPPTYEAQARILISSQQIPKDFVRPIVEDDPLERINAVVGEMQARPRLVSLIRKYDLYPEIVKKHSLAEAVDHMRQSIEVKPDDSVNAGRRGRATVGIYMISFHDENPKVAAKVANDLAAIVENVSSTTRTQQARLTTKFLRNEMESTKKDLQGIEGKITDFKEKYRGELPTDLPGNLNQLDRLGQQRQSLEQQISDAQTRLAVTAAQPAPEDPDSPSGRLSALKAQLAAQLAVNTEDHPNVISLRRQIAALEEQIKNGAPDPQEKARQVVLESSQRSIDDLRHMLDHVNDQITKLQDHVSNTPQREEALNSMEQKAGVLREKYLDFLRKVEAAQLSENLETAQEGERVSVLDHAVPPLKPDSRRLKHALLILIAGLGLSGGIGVLLELVDPVLVSREQLEELLGVPVIGSVPRMD